MIESLKYTFNGLYYFELPYLCASELAEMARELATLAPALGPVEVDRAVEQLVVRAEQAEAAIAALADHYEREAEQREVEFEEAVDEVARRLHQGLAHWEIYAQKWWRETLERDPEKHAKELAELPAKLEKAERAEIIFKSLFGEDGIDYFRLRTLERVQALSAMLRTLADDALEPSPKDLIWVPGSSDSLDFAEASLAFETKVAKHRREHAATFVLGDHRVALRWAVLAYSWQIRLITDRWSKESCDRWNEYLAPMNEACRVAELKRRAKIDERIRQWEAEAEAAKAARGVGDSGSESG